LKFNFIHIIIVFVFLLINKNVFAQPDRYWSVTFNTEASMLAGAVVGDNSDITSIYFNPAGISQIEDKKLMLNANLFKLDFETYSQDNSGPNSYDRFDDLGFRVQPRFVSYTYRSRKHPKISFQFAVFNRDYELKSVYVQQENKSDIFHSGVGETALINTDYRNDYYNYWGGIGSSYQISSKLSVGLSILGTLKNFSYDYYKFIIVKPNLDLLPDSIPYYVVSYEDYERVIMYDARILAKIGVKYKLDNWAFGLNVTLPSVRIMGNSDVKRKVDYVKYPDSDGIQNRYLLTENSLYRESEFKDPLSIALGTVFTSKSAKSQYYFTVEYFKGIDTYTAVNGEKSIYPEEYPEGSLATSYKFGTKDIVNFAVGYKRLLSENFDLILGYRTDFNAYQVSDEGKYKEMNEFSKVHNDLNHFTIGSNFNYKRASFILGFETSYGSKTQDGGFLIVDNNNLVQKLEKVSLNYSIFSIGVFLGFSLGF